MRNKTYVSLPTYEQKISHDIEVANFLSEHDNDDYLIDLITLSFSNLPSDDLYKLSSQIWSSSIKGNASQSKIENAFKSLSQ